MKKTAILTIVLGLLCAGAAQAATFNYQAILNGASEPGAPNASPGTGLGTLLLDDVAMTITVNESWTGLSGQATASHIHTRVPPALTGGVTFPFAGFPLPATGAMAQQVFAITQAQIANLNAGNMYFNIHTAQFGGGEIGATIVPVPEPASLALLGIGTLLAARRRRRA